MIRENKVKKMLKEGKSVICTFVKCCDPAVVEVIGRSGFDAIIIDTEHTSIDKESMLGLIRAADLTGIVPTVRIRENSAVEINQALDAGALGVQVPLVNNKEDAEAVVQRAKYGPIGNRGFAVSQRATGYGIMPAMEYTEMSNANTLLVVYCETAAAVKNIDDILSVKEVDVIFLGPWDLSQALGVTGNPNHPIVLETMDAIVKKARAAGKAVGTICSDAEQAKRLIEKGYQYIGLGGDLNFIGTLGKKYIKEIKG